MKDDLEGLNLVELYDALVQPDAPEAISMWPQTVGWLWVLAAVVVLLVLGLWKYLAWRRATAYRRAALAALREAGDDPLAISNVLRRTALASFPRETVAGLYGSDWLRFLDQVSDGAGFSTSAAGRTLAAAPYKPQAPHPELAALAAAWIRRHRTDRVPG